MVSGSADYGGLFLGADQIADREREKRRGAALDFGVYKLGREKRHGFLQAVFGILHENPEGRRGAAADNDVGERLLGVRLNALHLARRNRLDLAGGGGL